MDSEVAKTIVSTAAPIIIEPIKLIINTWLKPKIEGLLNSKEETKKIEALNVFCEYLTKTHGEHTSMNIIAFGLQQISLEQVYIPVKIYSEEKNEIIVVDDFDYEFVSKYGKIVIEDSAGMGKSTIMKKLFLSSIDKNVGIPIFIDLKYLSDSIDIIDIILEKLNYFNIEYEKSRELVIDLVSHGDFIFFLDGYDEIPFRFKQEVTHKLKQFIYNAGTNIFFLTSRPDDSLYSFGQFQKFSIKELEIGEAYQLFRKFDKVSGLSLSDDAISHIHEQLNRGSFGDLRSFLANPLLASLLYLTYRHKRHLPSVKIEFYEKVYDALYELHDLSKDHFKREKYSGLGNRNLQKVLMHLGFLCLKENLNEYDKNKLLQLISTAKSGPDNRDIDEELILKDLLETVPLITRVGLKYKWSHKSFMEYFAAYYIEYHEKREAILAKISDSKNFPIYQNMLDFFYDINRQAFDKVIIYPILEEFLTYIEENKKNFSIKFLEFTFNRIYILVTDQRVLELNPRSGLDAISKALTNKYSKANLDFSKLGYTGVFRNGGKRYLTTIYDESIKIRHILRLLNKRNSGLVKTLKNQQEEQELKEIIIIGSSLTGPYPVENETEFLNYLRASNVGRTLIIFDYDKVLEYRSFIEEETKNTDNDLFSIL